MNAMGMLNISRQYTCILSSNFLEQNRRYRLGCYDFLICVIYKVFPGGFVLELARNSY